MPSFGEFLTVFGTHPFNLWYQYLATTIVGFNSVRVPRYFSPRNGQNRQSPGLILSTCCVLLAPAAPSYALKVDAKSDLLHQLRWG